MAYTVALTPQVLHMHGTFIIMYMYALFYLRYCFLGSVQLCSER